MAVTFEAFRGDVAELERMAMIAIRDEYKIDSYPNLYSARYFDFLFGALEHPDHLIGAYEDGKLVSFMAALPRRFYFKGGEYSAVLACALVTRMEAFRRGMALGLTAKALELNEKYGYDFALLYLETGHRSSKMLAKLKSQGAPVVRVKRMNVIARALDLGKIYASENVKWYEKAAMGVLRLDKLDDTSPASDIRPYRSADLDGCHRLLDSYRNSVTLTRIMGPGELARELSHPETAHTLVWERNGEVAGLVNWAVVDHLGKVSQPWAWLNHVHFGDLRKAERRELMRAFLVEARKHGACGVIEWSKNYYGKGPLWRNRFIPYPRRVDMLAWVFNPELDLSGISDVYELQI